MESKGKKLRARNKGNTQDPSWEFLHTCQQRAITWALNRLAAHIERDVIDSKSLNDHKAKSTLKKSRKDQLLDIELLEKFLLISSYRKIQIMLPVWKNKSNLHLSSK